MPAITDNEPHSGHMAILAGLLKNVIPAELSTHVGSIINLFVKPEICELYDPLFKKYLLQVIEYMIIACKIKCQEFHYELFKIYITIQAKTFDQFDNHCKYYFEK